LYDAPCNVHGLGNGVAQTRDKLPGSPVLLWIVRVGVE